MTGSWNCTITWTSWIASWWSAVRYRAVTGYGCRRDVVRPSCSLGTEQRLRTRNDEYGRSTKRPGLGRRGRALNEGAATQPVVDAVPEPSNRYVRSTRRQSDHAVAEQCRCRSSLTLLLLSAAAPLWATVFLWSSSCFCRNSFLVTLPKSSTVSLYPYARQLHNLCWTVIFSSWAVYLLTVLHCFMYCGYILCSK